MATMEVAAGPAGVSDPADRALSAHTRRAYAGDWRAFVAWCEAGGHAPLPADPAAVAAHLADCAASLGRGSLRRRLAAIAHQHRRAGLPWERRPPAVTAILGEVRAAPGRSPRPAAALTAGDLGRLLATCGDDTAGARDRALLSLAFAGALRRSVIVALERDGVRFTEVGMTLSLPAAGTPRAGKGEEEATTLAIARGPDPLLCPVRAMEAWLRRSRIEWGAVFRRLSPGGALEGRLSPQGVWRILRVRAGLARLTVEATRRLSPQALRAGAVAAARVKAAAGREASPSAAPEAARAAARPGRPPRPPRPRRSPPASGR